MVNFVSWGFLGFPLGLRYFYGRSSVFGDYKETVRTGASLFGDRSRTGLSLFLTGASLFLERIACLCGIQGDGSDWVKIRTGLSLYLGTIKCLSGTGGDCSSWAFFGRRVQMYEDEGVRRVTLPVVMDCLAAISVVVSVLGCVLVALMWGWL